MISCGLGLMYGCLFLNLQDHTFCGVMFTIECKSELPVEFLEIRSLSVRGQLGPITVWVTPDTWQGKHENEKVWEQVYSASHPSSYRSFTKLAFSRPVIVAGGQSIGVYVHSAVDGDEVSPPSSPGSACGCLTASSARNPPDRCLQGIVYDNERGGSAHEDSFLRLGAGLAHLSNVPFSPLGFWGRAWRSHRQFVGRVEYGYSPPF